MFVAALLSLPATTASGPATPTLRDHPIASPAPPVYLDGSWSAQHHLQGQPAGGPMAATVPGDILTDLQRAGRQPDPYYNSTWREPSFIAAWNEGTWEYRTTFATPTPTAEAHLLVFDGVRMGAMLALNGKALGNATDQFMRYIFDVGELLHKQEGQENTLTVTFGDSLLIDCGGRYTYSSEIDWAPTMLTKDSANGSEPDPSRPHRSTFGFGIWKSVYVLPVPAAAPVITQLVSHTFYAGKHPTSALTDSNHKGFRLEATVELLAPTAGQSGQVTVWGDWPGAKQVSATLSAMPAGVSNATVAIDASQTLGAKLWQPHGHGAQNLYKLQATFTPTGGAVTAATSRNIGFRHVALVTVNDTESAAHGQANGNGQFTMFFRVNVR